MNDASDGPEQALNEKHELLLRVLPMSASLAGICIAAVTLFKSNDRLARMETLADDLLAVCSLLFLCSTYLSFWGLRTRRLRTVVYLSRLVDASFLAALTLLVAVGFLMVYTIF